jgi:hypothetical protein
MSILQSSVEKYYPACSGLHMDPGSRVVAFLIIGAFPFHPLAFPFHPLAFPFHPWSFKGFPFRPFVAFLPFPSFSPFPFLPFQVRPFPVHPVHSYHPFQEVNASIASPSVAFITESLE